MQEIIIFQAYEIKIIRISTDIYFNARDVYRALEQPHDRHSLKKHLSNLDNDYKKSLFELCPSGTMVNRTIYFLTFAGLCRIIASSSTEQTKLFETYIFTLFLPSLKAVQDEIRTNLEKDLEKQKFITYELATTKNSLAVKYAALEYEFVLLQTLYKKLHFDFSEMEKDLNALEDAKNQKDKKNTLSRRNTLIRRNTTISKDTSTTPTTSNTSTVPNTPSMFRRFRKIFER
ncbi:putative Bro-N domain-containing protein 18 [Diachasmimorpha longicaudata entomopoxvirus]|uniref:Putative Bro-N domain-containing protein 18 n=1 Tax=Diachasmimorpha longicaudata entomopoxvirus TaxID=109981 RepID=A0A7R5WP13_9POXV|nr:putative Bro-N domain-containing protein 18 [Diachasmimorpha longicaudata entomopoxvirus]AKS26466.1 putative Bro-N domain-containing protein 18 [Diachasmimorpha longicaudata entomopoxvirus]